MTFESRVFLMISWFMWLPLAFTVGATYLNDLSCSTQICGLDSSFETFFLCCNFVRYSWHVYIV